MPEFKLQVASDLHLEAYWNGLPHPSLYEADPHRDILILAGDIGVSNGALDFVLRELKLSPIVYVPGNHEYFAPIPRHTVDRMWHVLASKHEHLHYLVAQSVVIKGIRFWGAPWYTDLWGDLDSYLPLVLSGQVADFNHFCKAPWTVKEHLESHRLQTQQLLDQAGKVDVVVTHWPPTKEAIHPKYSGDELNPYYVNDHEDIVRRVAPKLWVSGHTHESFDYWIGETHCLGNPSGYTSEWQDSDVFRRCRIVSISK